jgi:hypothetical protein
MDNDVYRARRRMADAPLGAGTLRRKTKTSTEVQANEGN